MRDGRRRSSGDCLRHRPVVGLLEARSVLRDRWHRSDRQHHRNYVRLARPRRSAPLTSDAHRRSGSRSNLGSTRSEMAAPGLSSSPETANVPAPVLDGTFSCPRPGPPRISATGRISPLGPASMAPTAADGNPSTGDDPTWFSAQAAYGNPACRWPAESARRRPTATAH